MTKSLSRRTMLKCAALSALVAPFLGGSRGAVAQSSAPKRLVWMTTPNGTIMQDLWPSGASFDDLFAPGRILHPEDATGFADFKPKLLALRGIDVKSALKTPVPKDHQPDNLNMLIARQPTDTEKAKPAGKSIDQRIAEEVGQATPFSSLELGTGTFYNSWSSCVASGPNQPIKPIQSPREAFLQLFSNFTAPDDSEAERRAAERLSVLDHVSEEIVMLEKRLGCEDRTRLQSQLAAIEELEKQLTFVPSDACTVPGEPSTYDANDPGQYADIIKAHMDLIVATLACDLTRVVTLQLGRRGLPQTFAGVSQEHHVLAHYNASGKTEAEQRALQSDIEHAYAQHFYHLVRSLDAIPEGAGTMLDNTVVVWAHEQGRGKSHSRLDHSYILAGSCGGAIPTGHRRVYDGVSHSGLLIALAQAMGTSVTEWGDPDFSNGPLDLS